MGWTKVDREKFLKAINDHKPTSAIRNRENLLFDDIIEEDKAAIKSLKLILKYPAIDNNVDGDPMPKQSARFTVARHMQGPAKGEPIIYINKRTGKKDVIIKSYQEAKITNTEKMLREQIIIQMKQQGFHKFTKAVFITHMEFIFKVSENAPKYMLKDLEQGNKIYFKETKPDLDNLEKLVLDALETEKIENDTLSSMRGLVYDNDAQIVLKTGVFKRWGIRPGVIIHMEGLV